METRIDIQVKPLKGILKIRSRGEFVILLQQILRTKGYTGVPIDGYFDKNTELAVIDFQGNKALKQDGIVGSKTWMLLNDVIRAEPITKVNVSSKELVGVLKVGKRGEMVLLLQENLIKLGYELVADGIFGVGTQRIVREFQGSNGLSVDGIVGVKTWLKIEQLLGDSSAVQPAERRTVGKLLSENDLLQFANRYGLDVAAVKAVHEVESSGRGFNNNKIKILFEGHIFWRELKKVGINPASKVVGNENIIYSKWIRTYYNQNQHSRLEKAKNIHKEAAFSSASYGLFQVMGFHASSLGFEDAQSFVDFMDVNEANQLEVFGRFIKKNNLIKYLKDKNWASFARRYNGPGYAKNKYDTKMATAYLKYVNMGLG